MEEELEFDPGIVNQDPPEETAFDESLIDAPVEVPRELGASLNSGYSLDNPHWKERVRESFPNAHDWTKDDYREDMSRLSFTEQGGFMRAGANVAKNMAAFAGMELGAFGHMGDTFEIATGEAEPPNPNSLYKWGKELSEQVSQDQFILEQGQEGLGWAPKNLSNLATDALGSLGMLVPDAIIGVTLGALTAEIGGAGAAIGVLRAGNNLKKIKDGILLVKNATSASERINAARRLSKVSAEISKRYIAGLSPAQKLVGGGMGIASRMNESYMESLDAYQQQYEDLMSRGYTEQEAARVAGETATKVTQMQMPLAALDILQVGTLFGAVGKGVAKSLPGKVKTLLSVGANAATEGFEEVYQTFASDYSTKLGSDSVQGDSTDWRETVKETLANDETWYAFMAGALGGAALPALSKPASMVIDRLNDKRDRRMSSQFVRESIAATRREAKILETAEGPTADYSRRALAVERALGALVFDGKKKSTTFDALYAQYGNLSAIDEVQPETDNESLKALAPQLQSDARLVQTEMIALEKRFPNLSRAELAKRVRNSFAYNSLSREIESRVPEMETGTKTSYSSFEEKIESVLDAEGVIKVKDIKDAVEGENPESAYAIAELIALRAGIKAKMSLFDIQRSENVFVPNEPVEESLEEVFKDPTKDVEDVAELGAQDMQPVNADDLLGESAPEEMRSLSTSDVDDLLGEPIRVKVEGIKKVAYSPLIKKEALSEIESDVKYWHSVATSKNNGEESTFEDFLRTVYRDAKATASRSGFDELVDIHRSLGFQIGNPDNLYKKYAVSLEELGDSIAAKLGLGIKRESLPIQDREDLPSVGKAVIPRADRFMRKVTRYMPSVGDVVSLADENFEVIEVSSSEATIADPSGELSRVSITGLQDYNIVKGDPGEIKYVIDDNVASEQLIDTRPLYDGRVKEGTTVELRVVDNVDNHPVNGPNETFLDWVNSNSPTEQEKAQKIPIGYFIPGESVPFAFIPDGGDLNLRNKVLSSGSLQVEVSTFKGKVARDLDGRLSTYSGQMEVGILIGTGEDQSIASKSGMIKLSETRYGTNNSYDSDLAFIFRDDNQSDVVVSQTIPEKPKLPIKGKRVLLSSVLMFLSQKGSAYFSEEVYTNAPGNKSTYVDTILGLGSNINESFRDKLENIAKVYPLEGGAFDKALGDFLKSKPNTKSFVHALPIPGQGRIISYNSKDKSFSVAFPHSFKKDDTHAAKAYRHIVDIIADIDANTHPKVLQANPEVFWAKYTQDANDFSPNVIDYVDLVTDNYFAPAPIEYAPGKFSPYRSFDIEVSTISQNKPSDLYTGKKDLPRDSVSEVINLPEPKEPEPVVEDEFGSIGDFESEPITEGTFLGVPIEVDTSAYTLEGLTGKEYQEVKRWMGSIAFAEANGPLSRTTIQANIEAKVKEYFSTIDYDAALSADDTGRVQKAIDKRDVILSNLSNISREVAEANLSFTSVNLDDIDFANYDIDITQVSPIKSASTRVKTMLSSIQRRDINNVPLKGVAGIPILENPVRVVSELRKAFSNGNYPESPVSWLKNRGTSISIQAAEAYERMGISDRASFKRMFSPTSNIQTTLFNDGKGNIVPKKANEAVLGEEVLKRWRNDLLRGPLYSGENDLAQSVLNRIGRNSGLRPVDLKNIFAEIGITLNDQTVNSLNAKGISGVSFDILVKANGTFISDLRNYLSDLINDPDSLRSSTFLDSGSQIAALANLEGAYSDDLLSDSSIINNKRSFNWSTDSLAEQQVRNIKNDPNRFLIEQSQSHFTNDFSLLVETETYDKIELSLLSEEGIIGSIEEFDSAKKSLTEKSVKDQAIYTYLLYQTSKRNLSKKVAGASVRQQESGIPLSMSRIPLGTISDKKGTYLLDVPVYDLSNEKGLTNRLREAMYNNLVRPELNRIINHYSSGAKSDIRNVDVASRLFLQIPQLNALEVEGKPLHVYLKDVFSTTDNVDKERIKLERLLKNVSTDKIYSIIEANAKETLETLDDPSVHTYFLSKGLADKVENKVVLREGQITPLVVELEFNNLVVRNVEHQVLLGDKTSFSKIKERDFNDLTSSLDFVRLVNSKVEGNVNKRRAALKAPRNTSLDSSGRYVQLIVQDRERLGDNLPNLAMLAGYSPTAKDIETLQSGTPEEKRKLVNDKFPKIIDYTEIEDSDAQEYATAKEHLNLMHQQGMITDDKFEKVSKLMVGDNYFIPNDLIDAFQPIKPVYTGYYMANGRRNDVYLKTATVPLLPQFTKGFELDLLRKDMEAVEKKVGAPVRLTYSTGTKLGIPTATKKIWAEDGSYIPGNFDPDTIKKAYDQTFEGNVRDISVPALFLDRKYHGIQQNIPYKSKPGAGQQKVKLPVQMMSILPGAGVSSIKGNVFEFEGKMVDAETIFNEWSDSINAYTDANERSLLQELSINPDTGLPEDRVKFLEALAKRFKTDAFSRELTPSEQESLDVAYNEITDTFDFKQPIWTAFDSDRFQRALVILIKNAVNDIQVPGYKFVKLSSEGISNFKEGMADSRTIFIDRDSSIKEGLKASPTANEQKETVESENPIDNRVEIAKTLAKDILVSTDTTFRSIEGGAGVGKSTFAVQVIKELINKGVRPLVVAPTNQAKSELARKGPGVPVRTLDSAMGVGFDTDTGKYVPGVRENLTSSSRVIFMDEMSMYTKEQLDNLRSSILPGTQVIFMGDRYQSFGMNRGLGPAFDLVDDNNVTKFTERKRASSDSPINRLSDSITKSLDEGSGFDLSTIAEEYDPERREGLKLETNRDKVFDDFVRSYLNGENVRLVTFNNELNERKDSVKNLNKEIRSRLRVGEFEPGSTGRVYSAYSVNSRRALSNNDEVTVIERSDLVSFGQIEVDGGDNRVIQGYTVTVEDENGNTVKANVLDESSKETIAILTESMRESGDFSGAYELESSFLDLQPDWAITVDRSQGATYETTYVFVNNILNGPGGQEATLRSLNTAVTRSSHLTVLVDDSFVDNPRKEYVAPDRVTEVDTKGTTKRGKYAQAILPSKFVDRKGDLIDMFKQNEKGEYVYVEKENDRFYLKQDMVDLDLLTHVTNRTPMSGHQSSVAIEVVAFSPVADQIIVDPNAAVQLGEDHDADARFTMTYAQTVDRDGRIVKKNYLNPGTPDQERINASNKMVEIMRAVIGSPSPKVQKLIQKSLSTAYAQETANVFETQISETFSPASTVSRAQKTEAGSAGKSGIGKYSLGVRLMHIVQGINGLNPDAISDRIFNDVSVGPYTLSPTLYPIRTIRPDGVTDAEWKSLERDVVDVMAENQNVSTDNANLGFMGARGENKNTLGLFSAMASKGIDVVPVLVNGERKFIGYASLVANLKVVKDPSSVDNTPNLNIIPRAEKLNLLRKATPQFLYENRNSLNDDIINISALIMQKFGLLDSSLGTLEKIMSGSQVGVNNLASFENVKLLARYAGIGKYINGIPYFEQSPEYKLGQKAFNILDNISNEVVPKELFNSAVPERDIKAFLVTSPSIGISDDPVGDREKLINEGQSLAEYVELIKPLLSTNSFVSKLQSRREIEGKVLLNYVDNGSELEDPKQQEDAFLNLIEDNVSLPDKNGAPYSSTQLAEDLFKYSVLVNGGTSTFGAFSRRIPQQIWEASGINERLREFNGRLKNGDVDMSKLSKLILSSKRETPLINHYTGSNLNDVFSIRVNAKTNSTSQDRLAIETLEKVNKDVTVVTGPVNSYDLDTNTITLSDPDSYLSELVHAATYKRIDNIMSSNAPLDKQLRESLNESLALVEEALDMTPQEKAWVQSIRDSNEVPMFNANNSERQKFIYATVDVHEMFDVFATNKEFRKIMSLTPDSRLEGKTMLSTLLDYLSEVIEAFLSDLGLTIENKKSLAYSLSREFYAVTNDSIVKNAISGKVKELNLSEERRPNLIKDVQTQLERFREEFAAC